jgi:hypothetical protein
MEPSARALLLVPVAEKKIMQHRSRRKVPDPDTDVRIQIGTDLVGKPGDAEGVIVYAVLVMGKIPHRAVHGVLRKFTYQFPNLGSSSS